jgi:hypothetical protein
MRCRGPGAERGTILFLFPAAVLIMFILGAIVIDVSLTQVRARELEAVAESAASDALAALDIVALRNGEGFVIPEADAALRARASVAAGPLPNAVVDLLRVDVDSQGRTIVAVTLSLTVDLVMAPGVGDLDQVTLTRTGRATILGSELL